MSDPEQKGRDVAQMEATAAAVTGLIEEEERLAPSPLQRLQRILHRYPALGPLLVLAIMMAVFALNAPEKFLTAGNVSLVIQQVAVVGTLAIGQTLIILTAGVDLSVGAIAVLTSIVMANLSAEFGVPGIAALLLGFAFGTACGLLNGLLITRLRMPPFIVTLGTLSIFFALNLFILEWRHRARQQHGWPAHDARPHRLHRRRQPHPRRDRDDRPLRRLHVCAPAHALGRHIYATGDDPESARLTGIRVDRVLITVYAVAGLLYAFGAWFLIGRVNAATPRRSRQPTWRRSPPWSSVARASSADGAASWGRSSGP